VGSKQKGKTTEDLQNKTKEPRKDWPKPRELRKMRKRKGQVRNSSSFVR